MQIKYLLICIIYTSINLFIRLSKYKLSIFKLKVFISAKQIVRK